jgi:hypothetical protein
LLTLTVAQFLAENVAFYTWPSLGCPSAIGWREEHVAVVGRPTTAVLCGKGHFAFVGMFPHVLLSSVTERIDQNMETVPIECDDFQIAALMNWVEYKNNTIMEYQQ